MRELREMGLYIDEHRDFNEGMAFLREGKGKERKKQKFAEKPKLHEGKTWGREDDFVAKD